MPRDDLHLDNFVCFAIYSASHAFARVYKPLLDPLGLTYPRYLVMTALWEEDGRTVSEIGERVLLESNTLTPLLKRLEADGLITRARDAADERQVRIRLTPQGRALRQQAAAIPAQITCASGRTGEALARLRADIVALRDALDSDGEKGAA